MIAALGFHNGDADRCATLLDWIGELGKCDAHDFLLVADAGTPKAVIKSMFDKAAPNFKTVVAITNRFPVSGWIAGSNSLFLESARWCEVKNVPWLWLETDCVPLKTGWLDAIESGYRNQSQGYFGHIYDCVSEKLPNKLLSGIAVYPANAFTLASRFVTDGTAFDVALARHTVPLATHTALIKHIWGTPHYPPRFYRTMPFNPMPNSFTMNLFPPECVLFHRVKDDSLISLLSNRPSKTAPLLRWMIWPFCNKDADIALRNMQWIAELNRYDWNLLLSYPVGTRDRSVSAIRSTAAKCFNSVSETRYSDRMAGWPPNIAFQHAARFIAANINEAWLWMEPDAVPLKPEWLEVLREEYGRCGKLFANPHVQGMAHANGTGIYPADTPHRIPIAMIEKDHAWDTRMAPEMMRDCHDINHLFFHVWTMDKENFYAVGGGETPTFRDQHMVNKIPVSAVVFHRNKDLTLIDRLRERKTKLK